MSDDPLFDKWWEHHGQYVRAGGGQYEISFAFAAWQASRASLSDQPVLTDSECEQIANIINMNRKTLP